MVLLPLATPADTAGASAAGPAVVAATTPATPHGAAQSIKASGPRRGDEPDTGLGVSLEEITPAYLQPGEPITVRGTITNLDRERWRKLHVYLLAPSAVATSSEEVADLAATPARTPDGTRITDEGLYEKLGALAPRASKPFTLRVPFQQLGLARDAYGVYTLAVQVKAYDELNNRPVAGRARTLITLMPNKSPRVPTSTVLPFRADVLREPNGEYPDRDDLLEDVSSDGRLRTMLDLARTSGTVPVSLLVDPAVLDALRRIATGDIGPPEESPSPSEPTTDSTVGAIASPDSDAQDAAAFLDDLAAYANQQTVWAEGYGRPDLAALSDYDMTRLDRTITRANFSVLSALDLSATRVYAPSGVLDVEGLEGVPPRTTTLVTSDQVRHWEPYDGPVGTIRSNGSRAPVVVSYTGIAEGGLEPDPTDTALQVRQRLLAETAVQSLEALERGRRQAPGLVMQADDDWNPGPGAASAGFFEAFTAPWVDGTDLGTLIEEGPRRVAHRIRPRHHVPGPEEEPIPKSLAGSADKIRGRGVVMYRITGDDRRILSYYDQTAVLAISERWRSDPEESQELSDETIADLDDQLASVTVEAPEFVTLSSSSGRFPLTITNGLPWRITVGLHLDAEDGGLEIEQDELIQVDPQQSTTVNVSVDAEDVAVSEITARLVTPKGRPFGEPVSFKMRSSVVGTVIWIAMGTAGAFVAFAVGRRIWRSSHRRKEPVAPAGFTSGAGDRG
jgi:Family of unknown function (DUF6049)